MKKKSRYSRGGHPIRNGEFDDTLTSAQDCRDLWAAKLLAYIHDALQPYRAGHNLPPKTAQGWFGTYDFRETCRCAGLPPEDVLRFYKERMVLAEEGRLDEALDGILYKKGV